jgi:hypothetical protein
MFSAIEIYRGTLFLIGFCCCLILAMRLIHQQQRHRLADRHAMAKKLRDQAIITLIVERGKMREMGYREWIVSPPPPDCLVQCYRAGCGFLCTPSQMPHFTDNSGVWWRLTGIGKMQLDTFWC